MPKSINLFILEGNKAFELYLPLHNNHGIQFNHEHEKLGIPEIEENWEINQHYSDQFNVEWWKQKTRKGHFKKITEYGIFNINKGTDYYKTRKVNCVMGGLCIIMMIILSNTF